MLDNVTYSLSHLDSHILEVTDDRNSDDIIEYKIYVTYGFHSFAKDEENLTEADRVKLNYASPKEDRPFNFRRYELSKYLPDIINSLEDPRTLVFHRGYENYATMKVVDDRGTEVDYIVSFSIFREQKKLRLHVRTAYPESNGIGKVKRVRFFTLAHNALHGKPMPKPPPGHK